MVPGALLVDGFFAGTWKITRAGQASATLVVEPYGRRLTKEDAAETTEEGLRLLAFVAPDREHEVRLTPPR